MAANIMSPPPDGPFDEDYLARLRSGDYETARHFNSYFRKRLRIMLCGAFRPETVNDLIDEVMFVVITNIMRGEPRDGARLPHYVRGVCKHLKIRYIDVLTRNGRQDLDLDRMAGHEQTAEEELQRKQTAEEVQATLGQLSERDRIVLLDLFYKTLTRDEICEKYGMTRDQLRLVLFYALRRFKRRWRGRNGE